MEDCPHLVVCPFVKAAEENDERRLAVGGFIRLYCKGDKQKECRRFAVCAHFDGDKSKVPLNMMPNGHPLPGTFDTDWSEEVKAAALKK